MVEANFKHPKFDPQEADSKLIEYPNGNKTVRIEYPDGIIALFLMDTEGGITIQSNRSFIVSNENNENVISPNLNEINHDFVDLSL